ncbi:hypothetical protein, partial [Streptomyces sp. NPDC004050]
ARWRPEPGRGPAAAGTDRDTGAEAGAPAGLLYRLLGLEFVLTHADWYAAAGLLSPAAAAGLGREVTATCRQLVPHAAAVVELLEVPSAVLRGPLAGVDYVRDLTE